MLWCINCGQAVDESEALQTNDYILHGEVDTRNYEKETTRRCPVCCEELVIRADRCACGRYKNLLHDWCNSCYNERDAIAEKAIVDLTKSTERLLSRSEVVDLLASYFAD